MQLPSSSTTSSTSMMLTRPPYSQQHDTRWSQLGGGWEAHASCLLQHELSQLQPSCFAAAGQSAEGEPVRWYQADPAALHQLTPDGVADEPHDARWTVHPTGQWVLGNHPDTTPEQRQQLNELLERHKGAFAYSLAEVPGYTGSNVSFSLIDPNKRMWVPQRR